MRNRKHIAWLALGTLEARPAEQLRAHLDTCAACRTYFEELSNITASLSVPEPETNVQVSPAFHRRLAASLRAEKPRSPWAAMAESFQRLALNWRVVLPAAGAVTAAVIVLAVLRPPPTVVPPARTPVQVASVPRFKSDLPPTIANYESVANRSLDQLDELLTKQGTRNPAPAPVYTASALALINSSE
ncbi:MAG TPA: zf-HC2 domain-containing protein [Candidatus Binatia bacterium]|nr:zf-HC2 domain-containing protein [Candidatus Binatia bacterium]